MPVAAIPEFLELAVPAAIRVVDKLPLLGSGKTDYVAATALARDMSQEMNPETTTESAKETVVAPERDVA